MELPSKVLEEIAFNTRLKIEEHMLAVMDKSIHEEHLSQPQQTNNKLKNGTLREQIPRKPLIFPSPNKQTNRRTNRQTKNFVHTEVPNLDPRDFSTMLLPTEL